VLIQEAKEKFQQLQKVISILGDEEKRAIYDETGCIDDDVSCVIVTSSCTIIVVFRLILLLQMN
jgi:curved DNA-binding protein CbpA